VKGRSRKLSSSSSSCDADGRFSADRLGMEAAAGDRLNVATYRSMAGVSPGEVPTRRRRFGRPPWLF
jgi:hypothetical protein